MDMASEHAQVPGWGIDKEIDRRPGYPLEQEHDVGHDTLAGKPPYAPTIPLRGLSGRIRQMAYRVPDWKPRHWLLLMLGDRIDVLESKLTSRKMLVTGTLGMLLLTAVAWKKR